MGEQQICASTCCQNTLCNIKANRLPLRQEESKVHSILSPDQHAVLSQEQLKLQTRLVV